MYLHLTAHHARATGNIYYVDQDEGSDSYDGLAPTWEGGTHGPWASVTHVIDGACSPLPCYGAYPTGSTIRFEDGETWTDTTHPNSYYLDPCYNQAQNEECSGSSIPTGDGQLTLTDYCNENCPQSPVYPVFNGNGDTATIQLYNQQWWDISNLVITDSPAGCNMEQNPWPTACNNSSTPRRGIYVYADNTVPNTTATYQHIYVSGVTVQDVDGPNQGISDPNSDAYKTTGGIVYYASNINGSGYPAVFNDVQVTGTLVHDVSYEGIILTSDWLGAIGGQSCYSGNNWYSSYSPSTNEQVESNTVYHVGGNGISVHVSSGSVISHNIVHDGGHVVDSDAEGIASLDNLNAVIEHNQVYDMQFHYGTGGLQNYPDTVPFDVDDCDNGTKVEYNYSHDNQGGFITIEPYAINAIVRYNISERDGYGDPTQEKSGFGIGAILKVPQNKPTYDAGQGWQVYNNTFYIADDQGNQGPGTQLLDVTLPGEPILNPVPLFENNLIDSQQNQSYDSTASCSAHELLPQDFQQAGTNWTLDYNDFSSTNPNGCPDLPQQNHVINNNNDPGFATPGQGFDGQQQPTGDNNSDWQQDAALAYAPSSTLYCTGLIREGSGDENVDFSGNRLPQPPAQNVDPGALQHVGPPTC